jgi:DNA-binding transcriptional LysR family regulator
MHAFDEVTVIVSAAGHPPIGRKVSAPRSVLVFENGCPHRKRLEDWYAKRGELPERSIELGSYHAMLGCVVAGMGIALLPESVLTTFPESKRLMVHRLPAGESRAETVLIWRKGAMAANIQALQEVLRDRVGRKTKGDPARRAKPAP